MAQRTKNTLSPFSLPQPEPQAEASLQAQPCRQQGTAAANNPHAGHRQRMKSKFLRLGGDSFDDHQLLELLLFYAQPQRDTNPLSHQLIHRFGSLRNVLDADPKLLKEQIGISDNTAALLKLIPVLAARYQLQALTDCEAALTIDDAAALLEPYFVGAREEQVYLLSVDSKNKVLGIDRVSLGSSDAVLMDYRRIVELALSRRAMGIFLAHSHMSGLALPSPDDVWATERIRKTLELLNVRLLDHLIFSDGDYVSLFQSDLIRSSND